MLSSMDVRYQYIYYYTRHLLEFVVKVGAFSKRNDLLIFSPKSRHSTTKLLIPDSLSGMYFKKIILICFFFIFLKYDNQDILIAKV